MTEFEASTIAWQSYWENVKDVPIELNKDHTIIWKNLDTIEDKDTGLKGYVLQNEDTGKVVISFEGTQLNHGTGQLLNDVSEDVFGIGLGGQSYTQQGTTSKYTGSQYQDSMLAGGHAEIDEEGNFRTINKNQFTEATPIVDEYVEKYGKENITFVGHSLGGGLAEYFAVQHDASAITFASAATYSLLTDEQQQRVKNGDYKDNIISYTYPDDTVGAWIYKQSIGSTYYMSDPSEPSMLGISTHTMKDNYVKDRFFDEDGYFKAGLLYDSELGMQINHSPLEMKNNGIHSFSIVIQSEIIQSFAKDLDINTDLIKNTEKSLEKFYDYYIQTMTEIKSNYLRLVGSGEFDQLTAADVEEILAEYGKMENGVPIRFDVAQYEQLINLFKQCKSDTAEIAFHMQKMGDEFDHTDKMLAGWLGFK
ncbi:lipase family protein [Lentibacillus sp. N15]|uniref:lipase family protein n=1 Tax=Lentibacillus songyuanensis TaxID=3136161 RepID=UPI0031BA88D5